MGATAGDSQREFLSGIVFDTLSVRRVVNLYLLLAFAFGAVTASAPAPVVRASVMLSRADGEGSQAAQKEIVRSAQRDGFARSVAAGDVTPAALHVEVPLTGAATPRAPATIG